jgi:ABC-type nitrate/sulfonate/bicarbonate transport system permease component
MLKRARSFALPVVLYAGLIAIWWLIAYAHRGPSSPYVDPPQLVRSVWTQRSVLWPNLEATAQESALGFVFGCGIAIVLSLVTVRLPFLGNFVRRISLILYSLPLIAIAPLLVILLGAGLETKVVIAALAAFFPVLVNFTSALVATDRKAIEMMGVLGASETVTSIRVRVPYALPALFAAFTISAPAAVIGATIAEWVGADKGLGIAILASMQSYNVKFLWSSIFVVSVFSLLSYAVFAILGRLLFPWHESTARVGSR